MKKCYVRESNLNKMLTKKTLTLVQKKKKLNMIHIFLSTIWYTYLATHVPVHYEFKTLRQYIILNICVDFEDDNKCYVRESIS